MADKPQSTPPEKGADRFSRKALTTEEQAQIAEIVEAGEQLIAKFHVIGGTDPKGDILASHKLTQGAKMVALGVRAAVAYIND